QLSFKALRPVRLKVDPGLLLHDQSRKRLASAGTVHVPVSAEAGRDVAVIRTGDCPDHRLEVGDQVDDAREGSKDPGAANCRNELTQAFELSAAIAWARRGIQALRHRRPAPTYARPHARELRGEHPRVQPERHILAVLPESRAPHSDVTEVSQAEIMKHRGIPVSAGNADGAVPILARPKCRGAKEAGNRAGR